MYLITAFAVLMLLLCAAMVINPDKFSNGIISFSQKKYFHVFEVLSRIIAGTIFIRYSPATLFPTVFFILGCGLILVGIGLMLTPPKRHKAFALWSANNFRARFRLIGIISIPISLALVYAALGRAVI